MAKPECIVTIKIEVKISFWEALKMRLAGGKYMQKFWREIKIEDTDAA